MKIFRDTTLKTKFFLSIILTAAVIVLILLSSVLTVFYRQFLDLQTESSVNQLHYIRDQLDYYLLSMNNYTRMIVADDNVQDYALKYRDEKESFTAADKKNMQSDIRRFLQSIPYIHSASIYATDRSFVVSTAIINHPAALEPVPFCESPEFFIRDKYSNYTLSTNVQTLSKILPFYDIASGSLLGYFEISITEEDISNIYRSNSTGTSHFFIVDNDGYVVSTDGSYELNSRYKPFTTLGRDIPTHFKTGENSICFVTCLEPLDWYIINEVDLAAFFRPVYVILLIAAAISVFCLGASMVISRKVSDTITKPLYHLIAHIRKVKQGLWVPVNENPSDTDIGLLFREFDSMIVAQEQLKDELLDSQRIQNKISVELLQQQVNPHFLYNTLDNICSLAELNEKEKLIGIVMNLSTFYRESLSNGSSVVTIVEELEITRSYISIMQIRYFNKFDFTIECPQALYSYSCLKLLLQPIVENSIYHGIKELDTMGQIAIDISSQEETIVFRVQDNGPGIPADILERIWTNSSNHFGIKNINKRIQLHYGQQFGLTMENATDGGLITTIVIPRCKEEEECH